LKKTTPRPGPLTGAGRRIEAGARRFRGPGGPVTNTTDKADGSKRRIHHVSFPPGCPTAINSCIPEHYGTITHSGIEDGIEAVQKLGKNCILVKHDFASAFRHIPVSPEDSPLLGFHWLDKYYAERFLPFGLRTAPYLFNLFAEVFH